MVDAAPIPAPPGARFPVRDGNTISPLIDGEPAFRRICEAVEAAQHSVWVTVAFLWETFRMPDGRGTPLEVLGRAAARGLDVRVVCWRPGDETAARRSTTFWGTPEHIQRLRTEAPGIRVRWDRAAYGFCQHQKLWLVDAEGPDAIAFVGGMNLNPHTVVAPGHGGTEENHDVYLELTGPCVADVRQAIAERWNGASERDLPDGRWGDDSESDLPTSGSVPAATGTVTAQVQRTIHADRTDGAGERTILEQTLLAIGASRRTVYLENQQIDVPEVLVALAAALDRGVAIVALVPAEDTLADALLALAAHPRFTLAGIAGRGPDGTRHPVWVHSKLMLVDDAWGSVGSANFHRYSLTGNAELNVAFWDASTAHDIRSALMAEHLGEDVSALDDQAVLRRFAQVARANRRRRDAGTDDWQGLVFSV